MVSMGSPNSCLNLNPREVPRSCRWGPRDWHPCSFPGNPREPLSQRSVTLHRAPARPGCRRPASRAVRKKSLLFMSHPGCATTRMGAEQHVPVPSTPCHSHWAASFVCAACGPCAQLCLQRRGQPPLASLRMECGQREGGEGSRFWSLQAWGQALALPFMSSVASGKFLDLWVPQFPHLEKGGGTRSFGMKLSGGLCLPVHSTPTRRLSRGPSPPPPGPSITQPRSEPHPAVPGSPGCSCAPARR